MQHGADVKKTKQDDWNDSALHYAAASGRLPAVQALLAAGCDPAAKNYAGERMVMRLYPSTLSVNISIPEALCSAMAGQPVLHLHSRLFAHSAPAV